MRRVAVTARPSVISHCADLCAATARFLKVSSHMASRAQDWMAAASCCEGPRPAATFADLPRAHRDEFLNFALVAAVSSAFFITLAIVIRPLPSRSLASRGVLPEPSPARASTLDTWSNAGTPDAGAAATQRARGALPRYELAGLRSHPASAAPALRGARRGNVFSRFLRGIIGRPSPTATLKTDPTS